MSMRIERLNPTNYEDFIRLHEELGGFCPHGQVTAWPESRWARSASPCRLQNEFFDRGQYDGYLLFVDDQAVGWCQASPEQSATDSLFASDTTANLATWRISCFHIRKDYLRQGIARFMLDEVLVDLFERGIKKVEAARVMDSIKDQSDLWNTPEIFHSAGVPVREEFAVQLLLEPEPDPEGD